MRTLIIGSGRDCCSVIKEFLEARGLIATVVLNYKEGIDKLFYEKPDLTILEITSHVLSPTLMNKIKGAEYFQLIGITKDMGIIEEGVKPVFLLEDADRLSPFIDLLKSYLAGSADGKSAPVTEEGEEESGELKSTSYPILLAKLYQDKKTGILGINSNVQLRVYFIKGVPVFAEGGYVETALGRMLLEGGKIKEADYEKAVEAAGEKGLRLGEVLVSMGLLSPHELNSFLELQVREKIIGGFNCVQGTYSFKSESSFVDKMVAYQIDLPLLLYEGIKRGVEVKNIEEVFYQEDEDPFVELTSSLRGQIDSLGVGPRELRFIQLLKDKEGMSEMIKMSRLPKDETFKLVYFLYLLGLLKVSGVPLPEVEKTLTRRVPREKGAADAKREVVRIYPEDLIVLEEEIDETESEDFQGDSFAGLEVEGGENTAPQEQEIDETTGKEVEIGLESMNKEVNDEVTDEEFNNRVGLQSDLGTQISMKVEGGLGVPEEEFGKHITEKTSDKDVQIPTIEIDWEKRKGIEIELNRGGDESTGAAKAEETRDDASEKLIQEEEKRRKKEGIIEEILNLHSNMEDKSLYELLGISKAARKEEIKNAYFGLVKKFHPDAHPDFDRSIREKTEEIFTKITVAYETIYDDSKRKEYDSRDEVEKVKSQVKILYDAEIAYKAGEAFLKQRRYIEAEEKFLEAVNLNPEEAAYFGALVWARFLGENDKERVLNDTKSQLEKAISMNPKVAENYYYLGSVYKYVEDLNRAEANFLKAVECNPDYIEAKREARLLQLRKSEGGLKDKKREKKFWSSLFKR